ncbi:hypothetical protein K2173_025688 [Erythroxylum novogranatense]|uniref:DNAJ-containing protein X-domain domain-containing protein n=1 Tax=Erythroxylum novogranatense TaxID=1862640 RepID=A0AAV8SBS5_9ROSI|nr:hypothetical protein K2173_025688 [Erythroxylum novogranatense]
MASSSSIEIEDDSLDTKIHTQNVKKKIKVDCIHSQFLVLQAMQKEREEKLIMTIKNHLDPFVKGQVDEFIEWANSEAKGLSTAMLHIIGYIYTRRVAKEPGKGKGYMKVSFLTEWVQDKGHQIKSQVMAASAENDEESLLKFVEERKDAMLQSLWQINMFDIKNTLTLVFQAIMTQKFRPAHEGTQCERLLGVKQMGTVAEYTASRSYCQGSYNHY